MSAELIALAALIGGLYYMTVVRGRQENDQLPEPPPSAPSGPHGLMPPFPPIGARSTIDVRRAGHMTVKATGEPVAVKERVANDPYVPQLGLRNPALDEAMARIQPAMLPPGVGRSRKGIIV